MPESSSLKYLETRPSGRKLQGDATKLRFIESARDVIVELGFGKASNRAIADRAEANLALIKYHFGNKQGLHDAVIDFSVTELGHQSARDEKPASLTEYLRSTLNAFTGLSTDPNVRLLLAAMAESTHNPEIRPAIERNLLRFREHLKTLAETDGYAPDEAAALGDMVAALLDGLLQHLLLSPETDADAVIEIMIKLIARR